MHAWLTVYQIKRTKAHLQNLQCIQRVIGCTVAVRSLPGCIQHMSWGMFTLLFIAFYVAVSKGYH